MVEESQRLEAEKERKRKGLPLPKVSGSQFDYKNVIIDHVNILSG